MKIFFTLLLSLALFAGSASANDYFNDEDNQGLKSRFQSLVVGISTGAAVATSDAVTGTISEPIFLGTWLAETILRQSIISSLAKADNIDAKIGQAIGTAASWGTYYLVYSRISKRIDLAAPGLNSQSYLLALALNALVPLF